MRDDSALTRPHRTDNVEVIHSLDILVCTMTEVIVVKDACYRVIADKHQISERRYLVVVKKQRDEIVRREIGITYRDLLVFRRESLRNTRRSNGNDLA